MKNDLEIISSLIKDTIDGKLNWIQDRDIIKTSIVTNKDGAKIELVFEIDEDTFDEYSEYGMIEYSVYIDIFFRRNNGKLKHVKRIRDNQLRIIELINTLKFYVKKIK